MGFGNLKNDAGLAALNNFLEDKSYVDGYVPSQADVAVFESVSGAPASKYPHALRWYNNVNSYKSTFGSLPGVKQPVDKYGPKSAQNGTADDEEDSDDDGDLFGSSDEEESAEAARVREERLAQYAKKKGAKPTTIAKSMVIFDVKPWSDETDMALMEQKVRSVEQDGLLWGASKLVAVGYGIKKLQISTVIEDLKVSTDEMQEKICDDFKDLVQSVDIAAFNKL